jgi:hypothetical protein
MKVWLWGAGPCGRARPCSSCWLGCPRSSRSTKVEVRRYCCCCWGCRGVSLLEVLAMELKGDGLYVSRGLSFRYGPGVGNPVFAAAWQLALAQGCQEFRDTNHTVQGS